MKMKNTVLLLLSFALGQSAFAHSKAFTPEFVDTLVKPYLHIQTALAGDNFAKSQMEAKAFLVALEHAPTAEDASHTVASLKESTTQIYTAKDVKAARSAFLALSKELQTLVEHVGTTDNVSLYTAFCPMAFDGKGGSWLQNSEQVANPYYGAMMLRCGKAKKLP